jgi:hypothetical protein
MLRAYDEYSPGMGSDVVEWTKDQTRHRQGLERQRTDGSENRLNISQKFALCVAIFGITAAAAISYWSTIVAVVIALVAVGGPSTASILARRMDTKAGKPSGPPTPPPGVAT